MAVIRVNAHQMNIVTVTAPDFIDYEPYHVKLMARNEIAGAAKNVASIYKNAAPYGSIGRPGSTWENSSRQTILTVKYAVQ